MAVLLKKDFFGRLSAAIILVLVLEDMRAIIIFFHMVIGRIGGSLRRYILPLRFMIRRGIVLRIVERSSSFLNI